MSVDNIKECGDKKIEVLYKCELSLLIPIFSICMILIKKFE